MRRHENKFEQVLMTLVSLALVAGCAKEKKRDTPAAEEPPVVEVPQGPYVPPGNGPGQGPGTSWEWGGSAELTITGSSLRERNDRMSEYTGRPMNNPQNIRLNVNLVKTGSAYGGVVTISYSDNGKQEQGYFTSGSSAKEVQYNIWQHKDGKYAYHGFFEDFLGGLIVVLDEWVDLGDGNGLENLIGGKVYFKNFGLTYAPHPPTRCWFVSLGPYDCRAWKTDRAVDTTRAIYPDSGYVELGHFSGMNLSEAFNGEIEEILANH